MTEKKRPTLTRYSHAIFAAFCLFLLFLLLRLPSLATNGIKKGLLLCASAVIPALFPFMVLSELLISLGFGSFFGAKLGRPLSRLLGISPQSAAALFLGFLFGFPAGARVLLSLYDADRIEKQECERLLGLVGPPSIAFLISFVGASLYQNQKLGICLWLSCFFSSCLLGIFTKKERVRIIRTPSSQPKIPLAKLFTDAISNSLGATLLICAYILFFGTVCDCLACIFSSMSLPTPITALLFALTELTTGTTAASALPHPLLSLGICGFAVGFSGLSVHCQLLSLADGHLLSFRPYIRTKFILGLLCAAFMLLLFPLYA